MIKEKVSRKYARALMDIGIEDKKEELYGKELVSFNGLIKKNGVILNWLAGPVGDIDARRSSMEEILSKMGLSPMVTNFIRLLLDKDRLIYLDEITTVYQSLLDDREGRVIAEIVSASPLSKTEIKKINRELSSVVGKDIVSEVILDPSLIGGVVARVGGLVFDGSIKTQLENVRDSLKKG